MYMYQDFLARGELLRKENIRKREKKDREIENMKMTVNENDVFLPHLTSNSIKMLNSDLSPVSDSFNPTCQICHSKLCISAFNPHLQNSFSTCIP